MFIQKIVQLLIKETIRLCFLLFQNFHLKLMFFGCINTSMLSIFTINDLLDRQKQLNFTWHCNYARSVPFFIFVAYDKSILLDVVYEIRFIKFHSKTLQYLKKSKKTFVCQSTARRLKRHT